MANCNTVLLVDDDKVVLKATCRVLSETDLCLLTAGSADEALAICQDQEIAVLISDQCMPGTTGIALFQKMQSINPATIRILMTGDCDCREVTEAVNQGLIDKLIEKPWDYKDVIQAVSNGLSRYHTAQNGPTE